MIKKFDKIYLNASNQVENQNLCFILSSNVIFFEKFAFSFNSFYEIQVKSGIEH